MTLSVKSGLTAPNGFIDDVYNLDKSSYPAGLCGKKENLYKRYEACKDSFILVYDGEKLAGYVNMFPITKTLYEELNNPQAFKLRDDDITPGEITSWQQNEHNNIFVISVVVAEEYRNTEVIILLGNSLLSFLREKEAAGYEIASLAGSAVSEGGEKFLKRFRAKLVKTLEHDYKYYRTDKNNIRELIENGLLLKNL